MNIDLAVLIIILLFTGCLSLINTTNSYNNSVTMQSSPSSINHYLRRRSSVQVIHTTLNIIDDSIKNNMTLSTNKLRTLDTSHAYQINKDGSNLTKTQIKVIITAVIIISFIMLIMAIFRFKNACRDQETNKLQTEIIRHRASQYSEPSSRRGSIGYYTRTYTRTPSTRFDELLNTSLPTKGLSVSPADYSSKPTANVVLSSSPIEKSETAIYHVISSGNTSNITNKQQLSISIKPIVRKSCSAIGISRSRRLILCTVPPHILCRPNTVRYSLVVNVHDQRQRRSTSNRNIKVSSPTLRKLCLPCITARNHHHHSRQQSNKNKTAKDNQRKTVPVSTAAIAVESNVAQILHRDEVRPRTYDPISTIPVVHSSDYLRENDINHSHEQHQHFETPFHNEKIEKKDDETSVKALITPTAVVSESVLLPSSSPGNEITRSNEDDASDDQTPLLRSELASTIKDSSNRTTRKYSLNAFLPLVCSSNPHPLSSSSTTTAADGSGSVGDGNVNRNKFELKSRRRVSLSSAFRRNSFAKQTETFYSTIDSTTPTNTITSPSTTSLPICNNPSGTIDSDSSDRTSLLKTKTTTSKNQLRRKSSSITPLTSSTYRKDFMQKIERFRFIDDSASSTTTVTSPVESIDRINGHQPCSHLITSAIEQFDDYVRSRYHNNNEINTYIDRLNSDVLTNGSYSDLNILNSSNDNTTMQRPQTIQQQTTYKPVNNISFQSRTGDYRQTIRNSTPMTIPSQHSKHVYPSDSSLIRPSTILANGHSRSMDFQSVNNNHKHELLRPIALTNAGTMYETSSSSIATVTSVRSSTSLEFDDDTKPSGVLVDDDFLPMSSPVDDHFWDMTISKNHHKLKHNHKECFPNVGSSPDIEVKHFDVYQINTLSSSIDQPLSETSCDDDDDDDDRPLNQQKFSIHEYKLKELQKPVVIHRSLLNPSSHSTEQITNMISIPIKTLSLEQTKDESLLEKFSLSNAEALQIPIRSPPLRNDTILSSQQYPQTIYEEDDTQDSSTNENISDDSADNGEIDLVHEFELSQKQEQSKNTNLWSTNDRDIFILQEDDLLSALVSTPTQQINRQPPPSIMKITNNKSIDSIEESQATAAMNTLKPKVRFNLDPQYEREREWNKVNKLLGNSVEWTDEFEV